MKNILFITLLGLLLFPACRNNQHREEATEEGPAALIEETEVDELPNYSDLDMDEAMEAFIDGDKAAAALYIQNAANDLKEEGVGITGNQKALLEMHLAMAE